MSATLATLPTPMVAQGHVIRGIDEGHLGLLSTEGPLDMLGVGGTAAEQALFTQKEEVSAPGPRVFVGGAQGRVQIDGL
jgi:hypothetical protein